MAIKISSRVSLKLVQKHGVSEQEVAECFATREGGFLVDIREGHATTPETQWFISETYYGKSLKVVFILDEDEDIHIKTAYPPNIQEIKIYNKFAL